MKKIPPLCLTMTLALFVLPRAPALAGGAPPQTGFFDLEQQVLGQGPMLLGNLRRAREEGLRLDPWGMTYSLQQARRILYAMMGGERFLRDKGPLRAGHPPAAVLPRGFTAPLGQPLELDRPGPGGREQVVGRFDGTAGTIPLAAVNQAIGHALVALHMRPRALGAALLATENALRQVRWDKGLEPADWAAARDRALAVYALALDARPETAARLAGAQRSLAALPGGKPFARRLADMYAAPAPDLAGLSALVRDLDAKVRSLREAAEVAH